MQNKLVNGDVVRMISFALTIMLTTSLIAWVVTQVLKFERSLSAAVVLTVMLMNAGNYGLPLVNFAFGSSALAYASIFFVAMSLLSYSLGTMVASIGTANIRQAFINMIKIPSLYATFIALIFSQNNWQLPLPVGRAVELLGNATIPAMLLVLGMQLHSATWSGHILPLLSAVTLRLLAAPLIAFGLSPLFGLSTPAHQAGILESSMPSAVLTIILATEYNTQPDFVTMVVLTSTLLSPIVLTPLIYVLGAAR